MSTSGREKLARFVDIVDDLDHFANHSVDGERIDMVFNVHWMKQSLNLMTDFFGDQSSPVCHQTAIEKFEQLLEQALEILRSYLIENGDDILPSFKVLGKTVSIGYRKPISIVGLEPS